MIKINYNFINVLSSTSVSVVCSRVVIPRDSTRLHRSRFSSIVVNAPIPDITTASEGVIPTAGFMARPDTIGPSSEVLEIVTKLDPFTGELKQVPALSDSTRAARVEENAKVILGYVKNQYKKLYLSSGAQDPVFFDPSKYGGIPNLTEYTVAMEKLPKVLARGKTRGFLDACNIRIQEKRDIDQQLPKIGVTSEEAQSIKDALNEINAGLAFNAKTTQSASYVYGVNSAQKKFDREAFQKWIDARNRGLVGIVRLTIADVPLNYAQQEVLDFELDPRNSANRKALTEKLVALQKEALQEWRGNKSGFSLDTFLQKY